MITLLGTLGIGAVWGWLLVLTAGRHPDTPIWRQSLTVLIGLLLTSSALGATVTWLTDGRHLLYFSLAAVITFFAHQTTLARIRVGAEKT